MNIPGVNVVCITPDLVARNALINAIAATSGIKPTQRSDSVSAQRAHYAPAVSKLIINTAADRMHKLLGHHSIALAVEVKDRVAAANISKKIFEEAGCEATVHVHAEPEFPAGLLVFLAVPALHGVVLMFWPRQEDLTPEIISELPKREPWSEV